MNRSRGQIEIRRNVLQPQKPDSANQATSSHLDLFGETRAGTPNTVEDVVEMGGGCTDPGGDRCDRITLGEKQVFEAHASKGGSVMLPGQEKCSDCTALPVRHYAAMTWAQVDALKRHLKAYQDRTGKTQAEVAEDLETTYGTLRFWLIGKRSPKRASLQTMARVFDCSVTEFMDDPGAAAPIGIPKSQWDEATEKKRVLASAMFSEMVSMTDEEAEALYQTWKKAQEVGRARLEAEAARKAREGE